MWIGPCGPCGATGSPRCWRCGGAISPRSSCAAASRWMQSPSIRTCRPAFPCWSRPDFLAQITRHQNEVKYMSASLQYSNYSGHAAFAIPYGIMKADKEIQDIYKKSCQSDLEHYTELCTLGIDHDSAGYATPQGLRNVLIISATPYQWKHMIGQRTCRRNTDETRIVMLQIWQRLYKLSPILFAPDLTGPFCQRGSCMEKQMSCQNPISKLWIPSDILKADYPLLIRKEVSSHKD